METGMGMGFRMVSWLLRTFGCVEDGRIDGEVGAPLVKALRLGRGSGLGQVHMLKISGAPVPCRAER